MSRPAAAILGLLAGVALAVGALLTAPRLADAFRRPAEADFTATLAAVQRQATLTVLAGRFIAVINARDPGLLGTATRTTLAPGVVRYTLDLRELTPRDLAWDAATKTLTVTPPPIRLQGPEVDLAKLRRFDGSTLLTAVTGSSDELDRVTNARIRDGLLAEARAPFMLDLAAQAADDALKLAFELPLRATDPEIKVVVRRPR